MEDKPKIDTVVDHRIDTKIEAAKIIPSVDPASPVPSTTTREEDRKTAGQRKVNLFWESTQSLVAIVITGAVVYAELKQISSVLLGNAFTLIVALYFIRTNHTKTGGVGGTDSR